MKNLFLLTVFRAMTDQEKAQFLKLAQELAGRQAIALQQRSVIPDRQHYRIPSSGDTLVEAHIQIDQVESRKGTRDQCL